MVSKTSKQIITAVVITVMITFAISYVIFKYIPENQQNVKITEYKKELYASTLCQYSCPLTLQNVQNKSQYFPEQTCVQNCTLDFKALQSSGEAISNEDMKNDDLMEDMSVAVNDCKTGAVDVKTSTLNNTKFFQCSIEKLESLKDKYDYLN